MEIKDLIISIRSLRRNASRLKKRAETSANALHSYEKTLRKIESKLAALADLGIEELPKRKRRQRKFSFKGYKAYISSPEWARRREEFFSRHEYRCRTCDSTDRVIHLHHITYDRLYSEQDEDLMPLCAYCHSALHVFQKMYGLPVEEATSFWMRETAPPFVRECIRSTGYILFKQLLKKAFNPLEAPRDCLRNVFDALVGKALNKSASK